MTVTSSAPPARRPRLRASRFWPPIAVALVIIMFTLVAAWLEAPAPGHSNYLSPEAAGEHGSAKLAAALEDDGVTVDKHTAADEAFEAAAEGNTTLFLPAPDYLNSEEREMLRELRSNGPTLRIVTVLPSSGILTEMGLQHGSSRIATKTVSPQGGSTACDYEEIEDAGDATVLRQRYSARNAVDLGWKFCYDDALAWISHWDGGEDFVVGSPDPFSDEYFGQAGNQGLATTLLGANDSVVWLDKHSTTPVSPPTPPDSSSSQERSQAPIDYGDQEANPIYQTLPAWMWVGLVGLLLLGVMAALWKGRRLGPPVTEPLPVTVPGAETVHGRARLYRRGQAFGEAMEALRAGALDRMRRSLRLSSQSTPDTVVAAITARTNWPADTVRAVLYGPAPSSEKELLEATAALDALVAAVENDTPRGRN